MAPLTKRFAAVQGPFSMSFRRKIPVCLQIVDADSASPELSDKKRCAEHRQIFSKHCLLYMNRRWITQFPISVHHPGDGRQERH